MPDETLDADRQQTLEPPPPQSVTLTERPLQEGADQTPAADQIFAGDAYKVELDEKEELEPAEYLFRTVTGIQQARRDSPWDENWDLWEDMYFGVLTA